MCQTKVNRWFWKCADCLTPVAIEVDVKDKANHWTARDRFGAMKCGACGGDMWFMGRVAGESIVQDGHRCACDARCTTAAGPKCDCQCGGVNHGRSVVVPCVETVGDVPVAKVVPTEKLLRQVAEYRAARAEITAQLEACPSGWLPEEQYRHKVSLQYALRHSAGLTSHSGRMKCLEAALGHPVRSGAVSASLPVAKSVETAKPLTIQADGPAFALVPPSAGKPLPAQFANNTRLDGSRLPQKVLFSGSKSCCAGQRDLFGE